MREVFNENKEITSVSKQVELLKKHFPQAFDKDGKFIPQKIQEAIEGDNIDIAKEAYGLNWLGKSYARLLANLNEQTLLKADNAHNQKPQNNKSQNLLIKGDNLEVLKHLTHAYSEKIKMIYIDPPYNTGSDGFVYQDDRKFTKEELAKLANIEEDEAQRILDFTLKKSNSHSAWLTFMYPRLYIARELLREDGVIFISIDDNEQAQLKLLCDEIFGEENFVGNIVWEKKKKGTFLSSTITNVKEYILVYAGEKIKFGGLIGEVNCSQATYPCINASNKREVITIPAGVLSKFKERDYFLPKGSTISATTMSLLLHSNLVIKEGVLVEDLVIEGNWRYKQQLMAEYALNGQLYITQDLYLRRIVTEPREKTLKDLLLRTDDHNKACDKIDSENLFLGGWGSNEDGEEELRTLLGVKSIMDFPKPKKLMKKLCVSIRDKDAIILDFFAGSGTTAHAVMALNAEDGGERKCISVQIAEPTDEKSEAYKAGYPTIFDITKARIEKAAVKIQEDYPDYKGDLGFKIFETIPIFEHYLDDPVELEANMKLFDGHALTEGELDSLLTTWKLYDGIALDKDFTTIMLGDYKAHLVEENIYFMDKNFRIEALEIFLQKLDDDANFSPKRLIIFGYNFDSKVQKEITDAILNLKNKKSIIIDLDIRY